MANIGGLHAYLGVWLILNRSKVINLWQSIHGRELQWQLTLTISQRWHGEIVGRGGSE